MAKRGEDAAARGARFDPVDAANAAGIGGTGIALERL